MTDLEWIARNVHEWPTEPKLGIIIGRRPFSEGNASYIRVDRGGLISEEIYKDQWLSDRARLQNKPSWDDAPYWAKALGQDLSGYWQWLPHYDTTDLDHEEWMINNVDSGLYETSNKGEVLGDWRDTLERRPEANTKPELDCGTKVDNSFANQPKRKEYDAGVCPYNFEGSSDYADLSSVNNRNASATPAPEEEYTGKSVSYYTVTVSKPTNLDREPYEAECNDIIEALGMSYAEGNAFKAIWRRCAARTLGKAKRGYTDGLYDAEKAHFFAGRMVAQETD